MRKNSQLIVISVSILCVLATLVVCQGLITARQNPLGRAERAQLATPQQSVMSPSGKYVLKVLRTTMEGHPFLTFELRDPQAGDTAAPLFQAADAYSDYHATFILWDEADRVWVYSGDVGTFFWERGDDGEWHKSAMVDRNVPRPALLQKLRP